MNLETIKSYILVVLVGVSLLLTFALWSSQPEYPMVKTDEFVDSVNLGGKKETKKTIIEPKSVIFQNNDNYYSFTDQVDRKSFYEDMQSWVLYEFQTKSTGERPSEENQLEIIFPEALPMELAGDLFTFNSDVYLPDWNFKRLFITFNRNSSSLNIMFKSSNGEKQATAVVNNPDKFERLWNYLTTYEGLTEYLRVELAGSPIYIPKHKVVEPRRSIAVREINSNLMIDALFNNTDIVRGTQVSENEVYYTDSARGIMRVYQNRRTMVFQNPIKSPYEQMNSNELIERSIANINENNGWTDEFNLMGINMTSNTISYQMYYEGLPVFSNTNSSIIQQQFRGSELNQYSRPLFTLNNLLGGDDSMELRSGSDVVIYLENSSRYKMENVNDIKVGYHLSYRGSDDAVTLEPAWFIHYNGNWQQLNFEVITQQKGGS
ncbi:YycH family regulatory protein [Virgibacillus salinus]|uniref:Two-component signal transduction system YycFG, regulatory protein YycH n=1 Tax=Virgibacillus salinus TaxID=553311 RepID=A0A1H0XQU3_9BACI|nr:two-component system activity regulator YycH [Virgibacillus salinus]SDQ05245.1 Two-component signal transduction system YycFG, regulatory protein YycH [Virgibacillus salinus]